MECVPWCLTFVISLFVGLEFGMLSGFIISVVYLLYYAARPGIKVKRGYVSAPVCVIVDWGLTYL